MAAGILEVTQSRDNLLIFLPVYADPLGYRKPQAAHSL